MPPIEPLNLEPVNERIQRFERLERSEAIERFEPT
jgi:hypothetical protein